MTTSLQPAISFHNSYARLPDRFFARLDPALVKEPTLIKLNEELADLLQIDLAYLKSDKGIAMLSGNDVPEGAEPLAMAYAGHQFGHFVPQLGDGRALLLGEVTSKDGIRRDIQLKGSGPTPFSRMGDGRAALGPVLREYIVSEAMHAFGVPTTRALAAVSTGQAVFREGAIPGAVLTRVATSHVRVGTFQYFTVRQDLEAIRLLADHLIDRLYPEVKDAENPYIAFLEAVVSRQANLISRWMTLGFIHGVMNTDNMAISGETIDYGPCAFMDTYHPSTVYSSVDQMGRYAFANQPTIGQWNLIKLAQCLLPLFDEDETRAVEKGQTIIDLYPDKFDAALEDRFSAKLGLISQPQEARALGQALLKRMAENEADFTLTFHQLTDFAAHTFDKTHSPKTLFKKPGDFDEWDVQWRAALEKETADPATISSAMQMANPVIIPRNHLVEAAIRAAEDNNDFSVFLELTEALKTPFDQKLKDGQFYLPPKQDEVVTQTFCGT